MGLLEGEPRLWVELGRVPCWLQTYQIYKQIFSDVLLVPDTVPGTTTVEKTCQGRHEAHSEQKVTML